MKTPAVKISEENVQDVLHVLGEYMNGKTPGKPECWPSIPSLSLVQMFPAMVMVLDLKTKGYVYVSENTEELTGHERHDLLRGGMAYAQKLLPEAHQRVVTGQILPVMMRYFEEHTLTGDYLSITVSYCVQLMHSDGTVRWYMHTMKLLSADEQNRPHILLQTLSDMHDIKTDGYIPFTISRKVNGKTDILFREQYLPEYSFDVLSSRETEILQLISRGFTNAQIAEKLFISIHTVQTHRKNILRKTACKGTAKLAAFALKGQA